MELNIKIDKKGRQFLLDNNQTIVLVFPSDLDHDYSVASISFSPFGDQNSIEFKDVYEYASSQSIHFNDVITIDIKQKVVQGHVYTFTGVEIVEKDTAYSKELYGISNRGANKSKLTCGLAQLIVVNNREDIYPLNVFSLPYMETTYFKPTTKVWIFIASGIEDSMIISPNMLKPINSIGSDNQNFIDRLGCHLEVHSIETSTVTVGYYLEIDLTETQTPTVTFDSSINSFRV